MLLLLVSALSVVCGAFAQAVLRGNLPIEGYGFGQFANYNDLSGVIRQAGAKPPANFKTGVSGCMRQFGRMDNAPLNTSMRSSLNGQIFQTGFIDSRMIVAAASQQGEKHPNEDFFGVFHGTDLAQQSFTLMILADGHGAPDHPYRVPDKSGGYAKWNLPAPGGCISEAVVREAEKFFNTWLTLKAYTKNDIVDFIPTLSAQIVEHLNLMNITYEQFLQHSGSTVSITLLSAIGDIITVHSGNLGDSPGMMSNHFPRAKYGPASRSIMQEQNVNVKKEAYLVGVRLKARGYVSIPDRYPTYMRSNKHYFQVQERYVIGADGFGLQVTGSFGDFAHYEAKRNWIHCADVGKYELILCKSCVTAIVLASDGVTDKFDRLLRGENIGWRKFMAAKLDELIRGLHLNREEIRLHRLVEDAVSNDFTLTSDDTTMMVLLVQGYGYKPVAPKK